VREVVRLEPVQARLRVGDRLGALHAHRRHLDRELPHRPSDQVGELMVDNAFPVAVARPRRRRQLGRRFQKAGPGTYLFLILIAAASAFPLYWSFVVASHDNSAVSEYPPVLTPGSQLWHNIGRL